ncbi:endolytic transglycosylase MltG [Candidatus Uhrbacteria bacterium CG10_big_fil_rev_8_21_14_0_10_48_11]|uniref:Endolytic murein transglycosylase n=1 Tax=Candidatus Uhrbacteria bacterium CG10_big_fil_rev_8_21_14_0_10_48_11 TaxID=1975037 RepID=A0A2M8LDV1_9BACT|nr:MAG: endolytic transglycosylase MltG [Candidatus Uhrbacteria bacterium CG10_big_fil_rev_8_21_14_0_10_48_11]
MSSKLSSVFFLLVVGLVLSLLLYLGTFAGGIFRSPGGDASPVHFVITKNENLGSIAQDLREKGLIVSTRTFEAYVWLRGWSRSLQAGEYTLGYDLNVRELAQILASGSDAASERTITIIEGWTIDDIARYLEKQGVVTADDFRQALDRLADHETVSVLADKPASASLEGYLFPDSYRIFKGASADEVASKMLNTLDQKLAPDLRSAIAKRGQSIFTTLTVASILEKEIRDPADLPIAADVIYKRLGVGELLQSDATLNYLLATGNKKPQLTFEDLKNPSSYNTYVHPGLPPGPIANPGLAAIKAAIYPDTNDYWYFLTDKEGHTHFAKDYETHLANKRKYLDN